MCVQFFFPFAGLGKKIDKLARLKACAPVGRWKKSIKNHMYFVASEPESDSREAVMEAKWKSLDNHMHDVHEHDTPLYVMCDHPHLMDDDRDKEWLEPGNSNTNTTYM